MLTINWQLLMLIRSHAYVVDKSANWWLFSKKGRACQSMHRIMSQEQLCRFCACTTHLIFNKKFCPSMLMRSFCKSTKSVYSKGMALSVSIRVHQIMSLLNLLLFRCKPHFWWKSALLANLCRVRRCYQKYHNSYDRFVISKVKAARTIKISC